MKSLTSKIASVLFLMGAGYALYHLLLTDEARESVHDSVTMVKDVYTTVTENIVDHRGVEMTEDVLPNQVATQAQWEALGY